MRQHGINLPDPFVGANGRVTHELPPGASKGPRVRAAEQACRQREGRPTAVTVRSTTGTRPSSPNAAVAGSQGEVDAGDAEQGSDRAVRSGLV
jgi:hypothetical protein